MARKKKNQGHPEGHWPRGSARAQVILLIVATDCTFRKVVTNPIMDGRTYSASLSDWHYEGRCIHCNTCLAVTEQGNSNATIEHINPLCGGGAAIDPRNLALACSRCNNEKGIRHDQHAGKGGRADEVIAALQAKRQSRWREPEKRIRNE